MRNFKIKKFQFFPLLMCFLIFIFANCHKNQEEKRVSSYDAQDLRKKNGIVLKIQNSFYFNSDFEKYLLFTFGEDSMSLIQDSLSRLFDNFIEEKLFLEAARDKKISLSEEEQKEYVAKLLNESWANKKEVELDEEESKLLVERLLVEKYTFDLVKDIDVSEEKIKEYYEENERYFLRPERVKVSQILVESEDKAIEILSRLSDSSEDSFKRIAQEESIGVEASKGGEMGLFEMGQLPFEMEKVIFSLKENEVSPVVESSYGYHIFRLDKRYEPELIPEDQASPQIRIKILDQKIREFLSRHLENLKKDIDWSFSPENLFFTYQRNKHE